MMDAPKVEAALKDIELARREKRYDEMTNYAHVVQSRLDDDTSELAWRWRSRVSYELHMAGWQQGNVDKSMRLAEQSVREANRGKDPIGALFGTMNIAGHLFPAQNRVEDGRAMMLSICEKAREILKTPLTAEDVRRATRLLMNCYAFLINFALRDGGDWRAEVGLWLMDLEDNSEFQKEREKEWAEKLVLSAEAYLLT